MQIQSTHPVTIHHNQSEEQSVLRLQFEHDYILNALSFAGEFCGQYDCHAEADGRLSLLPSDQHLWLDQEWCGGEYTLSLCPYDGIPQALLYVFKVADLWFGVILLFFSTKQKLDTVYLWKTFPKIKY